jgi:L-Lysine epsilon oxidase N-terminal/L-lysine epsilon oxidase C-terminal domain
MSTIYRIHPAIGIARLGDSPDDYFVGGESPGVLPQLARPGSSPPAGPSHRDSHGRIKRQGARFRIYEYAAGENSELGAAREITAANAEIEWQVHLANRKAASTRFQGRSRRNPGLPIDKLIIDAGEQTIGGMNRKMKRLAGWFMDPKHKVALGDILTDEAGRLIVLGGFGKSDSVPPGRPLKDYVNNNGWHDDVSDGPIRARIRLKGSKETIQADPAWLIVGVPDFAPEIENVITLYDVVYNMMARMNPALMDRTLAQVSFTRDIYPILRRVSNMHWVSDVAMIRHAPGKRGHFLARLDELSSNAPEHAEARDFIFHKLRNPQGGGGNMPKLPASMDPQMIVSLTELQYARMEKWAKGEFEADWSGQPPAPVPLEQLPVGEQPEALDRAALISCVGAGRYPGIEAGQVMLEERTYDRTRPFRINVKNPPGWLTGRMAVPWQADYRDCAYEEELGLDWWPGQRPDDIWRERAGELKREPWVPTTDIWEKDPTRRVMMVKHWSELGFILKKQVDAEFKFVEAERTLKE